MTEDVNRGESIQEAFDHAEADNLRESRKLVGLDLEHFGLSETTRQLVDLTLFVSNAARSDNVRQNWETPSPPLKLVASEIKKLTTQDGETVKAELTTTRVWLDSLLESNRNANKSEALSDELTNRLEQQTLPAISLALSHFSK